MITISSTDKPDRNSVLLLPLHKDLLKKLKPAQTRGLSVAQESALKQAIKKGAPKEGVLPVYSGSSPVLVQILSESKEYATGDAREAGEEVSSIAKKYELGSITVLPGSLEKDARTAYREGATLGSYEYTEYKGAVHKKTIKDDTPFKKIVFAGPKETGELKRLKILQQSVGLTRDIIMKPPMEANPTYMERVARRIARNTPKVKVTVFKEADLKKMGCNGILGVGLGTHEQSRLIVLEYKGSTAKKPVALVGKGVTYDTGGLSLKPSQYMAGMKQDLGGAATVLGAFQAIAASGVKKHVLCVVPTVENCVNSYAYKPDDVIKMYNGVTVEITNTDAEGRVILGDALAYTAKKYQPRAMVNLATLTGACAYAVGNDFTAALGTDEKLVNNVIESGKETDEGVWELPLHQKYKKLLKSPIADIVNSSKLKAGTIEGGLFLQHFVPEKTPWCHLDIASVTFDDDAGQATGRNVRMLLHLVEKKL